MSDIVSFSSTQLFIV